MPSPRSACVLLQMSCANIAMSTHAPSWRRPARRRRASLIMCQSCNAFCINQRKEAKNARVQYGICPAQTTPIGVAHEGRVIDPLLLRHGKRPKAAKATTFGLPVTAYGTSDEG